MTEQLPDIPKLFGENVKKYRKKAGLTQEALSKRLEISQKHLSIIETGVQFASASLIARISKELNVSPDCLFCNEKKADTDHLINTLYIMLSAHIDRKTEDLYSRMKELLPSQPPRNPYGGGF